MTMLHPPILAFLILLVFLPLSESANFSFTSFDSASCATQSNLSCWGSVNAGNGSLNITPEANGTSEQVGRVLFRHPILAWPSSFSTTFTLRIVANSTSTGAGMSFIIAQDNQPSPPESYGPFLGILDPSTQGGVIHQLAVELGTHSNHVAIVTTSVEYPVAVRSLGDIGIGLKSGRNITMKIEYDGWEKLLQIRVAYAGDYFLDFLSHKMIMKDTVPQAAYVGFTGSSGHFFGSHQVLEWQFIEYDLPTKSLNEGILKNKIKNVLEIVIPIVLVLTIAAALFMVRAQRKLMMEIEKREEIGKLTKNAANAPKFFAYKQLSKATQNFSKENLLGSGGFGSVYKGVLTGPGLRTCIAVKKIDATSSQGEREYLAEICTIGRLRHKNLVQLQGWCHEKGQLLLVYEYMANGSLDRYIGKDFIDWKTRHKILSGLASVLLYLHEECGSPVVHRDVKPNNVMLDSNFEARLGDFGLARLLENNAFVTTMVAGTIGYLAPEVSYTGRATLESDVYSFGMVVIELVCGRRSKGMREEFSLVDYVWSFYENGSIISCADPMLAGQFDEDEVRRSLMVGLACVHPDQLFRPRIRKVVQILMNPDEPLMGLPKSRPTEVCLSLPSSSPSTSQTDFSSILAQVQASWTKEG